MVEGGTDVGAYSMNPDTEEDDREYVCGGYAQLYAFLRAASERGSGVVTVTC